MSNENILAAAKETYELLCNTLTKLEFPFERKDEELCIISHVRGDDLPIDMLVSVEAEKQMVLVLSRMPLVVPEDKRLDMALAVSFVNNMLVDGCFDYDINSGRVTYRMTNSFIESRLSEGLFKYLVFGSCQVIDEFNDKFLMLAKDMISITQFIDSINK